MSRLGNLIGSCKLFIYYVIILSMRKQKLSVTAARMKAVRDKRYAMTKDRKDKKAQNQREGQRSGSDIHHKSDGSIERVSINNNRGNFGDGTKNE